MSRTISDKPISTNRAVQAIEQRRRQLGLNRSSMARLLGTERSTYSDIIFGVRGIPLSVVKRAYRSGVAADDLLLEDNHGSK